MASWRSAEVISLTTEIEKRGRMLPLVAARKLNAYNKT